MTRTESANKYNAAKTVTILIRINKLTEYDILDHLQSKPNKNGYIKNLIKQDIIGSQ